MNTVHSGLRRQLFALALGALLAAGATLALGTAEHEDTAPVAEQFMR
ncbi:hypothetical protein JOF53_004032 [Crossiella equi]|uniref:Uncharacterized protein n=1 Tax=Crossiella equi TaxID=130796 RepID=A0ABS5AEZ7_9PSEU|nr:hypothetical protein [Crossiella equi]MBP2475160.1 hypothetical protein [Crossiella equi]